MGENDLERSAVPDRAIEKVRQQLREGKRRSEYLGGEEQGDVAVALGLSYITVERGSRTANVYKYGCGAVEEQQYAMLVQDKPRHTEPLPTEGGRKCGLVCYSRAACRDKDAPPENFPDFLEAEGLSELATICETASCLIFYKL